MALVFSSMSRLNVVKVVQHGPQRFATSLEQLGWRTTSMTFVQCAGNVVTHEVQLLLSACVVIVVRFASP
jgi:hypothetical protein